MAQRLRDFVSQSRSGASRSSAIAEEARTASPYSSFTQIYDFLIGDPAHTELRSAFERSVRRFDLRFRSMADIGCGSGRFIAELANLPIDTIGVDRSASMLALCRRRLAGTSTVLLRQDIRSLSLPSPVDLITCHNQTINYITVLDDLAGAFQAIARSLRRGGAFLFDFIARLGRPSPARTQRVREAIRLPDHNVSFEGIVDPARGRSTIRIGVTGARNRRGRTFEVHRQRWFSASTIARLLHASGFRVLDMQPIGPNRDSAWIYVVARKP
jgi:SAM-dependent methyltransferase